MAIITNKVGNVKSLSPDINSVSNVDNLSGVLDIRLTILLTTVPNKGWIHV